MEVNENNKLLEALFAVSDAHHACTWLRAQWIHVDFCLQDDLGSC